MSIDSCVSKSFNTFFSTPKHDPKTQVFHHGRWGWICADDSWDSAAAEATKKNFTDSDRETAAQLFIDFFFWCF